MDTKILQRKGHLLQWNHKHRYLKIVVGIQVFSNLKNNINHTYDEK